MAFYRATKRVLHVGHLLEGMGKAGVASGHQRRLLEMGPMHGAAGSMPDAWSTVGGVSDAIFVGRRLEVSVQKQLLPGVTRGSASRKDIHLCMGMHR